MEGTAFPCFGRPLISLGYRLTFLSGPTLPGIKGRGTGNSDFRSLVYYISPGGSHCPGRGRGGNRLPVSKTRFSLLSVAHLDGTVTKYHQGTASSQPWKETLPRDKVLVVLGAPVQPHSSHCALSSSSVLYFHFLSEINRVAKCLRARLITLSLKWQSIHVLDCFKRVSISASDCSGKASRFLFWEVTPKHSMIFFNLRFSDLNFQTPL